MSLMLEEIRQQPAALNLFLENEAGRFEKLRERFARSRPRFITLAGRGTSDNAGLFGRYLIEVLTGIPVTLAAPSVTTLYGGRHDYAGALVVGLSQSGESTDVNLTLEEARRSGAVAIGVTNNPASAMARLVDETVPLHAGAEQSVAATKTWTAELLAMYLLAWSLGARLELDDIRRIPEWTAGALECEPAIAGRADAYRSMQRAVVLGRGFTFCNALETALKLMEACYVAAVSFSSAEFLHGPFAIAEPGLPVFAFAPPGPTWSGLHAVLEKCQTARVEPLVITDRRNQAACDSFRNAVALAPPAAPPGTPADVFTVIPYAVPGQLLAAHIAAQKGLNPDRPRGLSKITQTF